MASPEIADDEKRQAMARVLGSRTFSRSEQLRGFLRYVCEAAFEGRAHELNEYALGVSVLGRPDGYSPAEDSGVRSRAYELRNKLKIYYRDEAPDDPIEIEIEKGAYVPRFRRRAATPRPEPTRPEAPEPAPPRSRFDAARWRPVALVVGGIVLAILSAASLRVFRTRPGGGRLVPAASTPEMEALWGPFLDGHTPLLISFEIRFFLYAPSTGLVVRDYRTNQTAEIARSKPLATFRERMGAPDLVETYDYADVGAVQAAFLLGRLSNEQIGLKFASALGWEDLWNSNVVFVGKSNANPTIRKLLGEADLDFLDNDVGTAVLNRRPAAGESTEYPNAVTHGAGTKYGVITVLPGPQPGHHVMLLTGSGAELMWALAQSVTDPARVKEIVSRVLASPGNRPAAFQVLIEATFESNVPISIRYVTHHVSHVK